MNLLKNSLMITTPDPVFNLGYRWSLLATDRFFVHTPGLGKALVAGYSTTRKGWNGEHKINGRPGYGWYFGRDAQWSGFAVLGYGDYSGIRSQLEFFNKFQDLNGKIFHEASTSGLVHYDAADATPLYICLAGRYFRHTNDTAFIRKIWPNIKKAINFCYSTDTDVDQLIENTNVGHGWVEGGKLFGSHSTIYMAGAWGAALREAAGMAGFLGDPARDQYKSGSVTQSENIDKRFWSDNKRFYAYGMDKNGSFRHVQTILPAVPIYFGMTDPEKAALCTREYAGNAFTTNWGVRILREDNPWFKPQGYHYGSVWPLFTGWAALADYTTGNGVAGYSHIMNNLQVYQHWGLGFIEEVLNGEEYQPSGVCPHQCWSETMVLQPAIEGLLGFSADAPNRKMILAPNLPAQWDSLQVSGIRLADQRIDFKFLRKKGVSRFTFHPGSGDKFTLHFNPFFPAGTNIEQVRLNGKELPVTLFTSPMAVNMFTSFSVEKETVLEIGTKGGISVLPVVQKPKPGDRAEGTRIISQRLQKGSYTVVFEGVAGSSDSIEVWSDGKYTSSSEHLKQISENGDLTTFEIIFPASAEKYQQLSITWKEQ
jgi:glycogen debranching enzyme